jgi:hypothetical protein
VFVTEKVKHVAEVQLLGFCNAGELSLGISAWLLLQSCSLPPLHTLALLVPSLFRFCKTTGCCIERSFLPAMQCTVVNKSQQVLGPRVK